ncbi:MAG: hypothetical protein C4519_15665 [Desulfobacteraceae bacterium]|nr:MAG: hypothetical protein C4519_15665 [Desulfobacteraceae bacterium]
MKHAGLLTAERMDEVMMICARENPVYEQVSNFSIALYVIGHYKCTDLMSLDDVDPSEAASILKEDFHEIAAEELPLSYDIRESDERFLVVFGDPAFPEHFAVLVNSASDKPYFSKLKFFGSGFDSLEELKQEFLGKDGVGWNDIAFFRRKRSLLKSGDMKKIYTIRDDGSYSIFEDESPLNAKEVDPCRTSMRL